MKNLKTIRIHSAIMSTVVLSLLVLFSGCNKTVKQKTLEEMVLNAKSKAQTVAIGDFKEILDHNKSDLIIDCRQSEDFIIGHIPGAINIPRGKLEFSDKISDRHIEIIVYGYTDDCSALSAETLLKLKYSHIRMLENGWKGWSEFYPDIVETGTGEPENDAAPAQIEESGGCG